MNDRKMEYTAAAVLVVETAIAVASAYAGDWPLFSSTVLIVAGWIYIIYLMWKIKMRA